VISEFLCLLQSIFDRPNTAWARVLFDGRSLQSFNAHSLALAQPCSRRSGIFDPVVARSTDTESRLFNSSIWLCPICRAWRKLVLNCRDVFFVEQARHDRGTELVRNAALGNEVNARLDTVD